MTALFRISLGRWLHTQASGQPLRCILTAPLRVVTLLAVSGHRTAAACNGCDPCVPRFLSERPLPLHAGRVSALHMSLLRPSSDVDAGCEHVMRRATQQRRQLRTCGRGRGGPRRRPAMAAAMATAPTGSRTRRTCRSWSCWPSRTTTAAAATTSLRRRRWCASSPRCVSIAGVPAQPSTWLEQHW